MFARSATKNNLNKKHKQIGETKMKTQIQLPQMIEKVKRIENKFKKAMSSIKDVTNIKCIVRSDRFEISFLLDGWPERWTMEREDVENFSTQDILAISDSYQQQHSRAAIHIINNKWKN